MIRASNVAIAATLGALLCGCEQGNSIPCDTPEPVYYNMDGTYWALVDYTLTVDGDEVLNTELSTELVVDQIGPSINFWGVVGQVLEDRILFDSMFWRRLVGGPGGSTNLYKTTVTGEVTLDGGYMHVDFELYADGEIISNQIRHFEITSLSRTMP